MNLPRREHRIELPGAGRTHRPRPLLSAHLTETLARPTMAGSAGSRPAGGKPLQQTALPAPQSRPRLPGPGPPGSFRAVAAAERPGQRGSRALRPAHLQAGSGRTERGRPPRLSRRLPGQLQSLSLRHCPPPAGHVRICTAVPVTCTPLLERGLAPQDALQHRTSLCPCVL